MNRFVIAAYVDNKYGVLTRVASLFMRKGFNIDSLSVGETEDASYSRITLTASGDAATRDHMVSQMHKLHNVKRVMVLDESSSLERELMFVKVCNTPENRAEVMAASEIYRGKIVDYSPDTLCVELTGDPSKINAFIQLMKPLGIVELCRTGVIALERNRSITS